MTYINLTEFQQKILDCVTGEEFNKLFDSTSFSKYSNSENCRQAMMHGMVMASIVAATVPKCTIDNETEPNKMSDIFKAIKIIAKECEKYDGLTSCIDCPFHSNTSVCKFQETSPNNWPIYFSKICKDGTD